jgi:hypothetical protein
MLLLWIAAAYVIVVPITALVIARTTWVALRTERERVQRLLSRLAKLEAAAAAREPEPPSPPSPPPP